MAVGPGGLLSSSSLDYIVTNVPEDAILSSINFQPGFSDHFAQLLSWETRSDTHATPPCVTTYESRRD